MTKIRHVVTVSLTAPYARLLKFVDGAPVTVVLPAQLPTVAPLQRVELSPDGKYILAGTNAASTTPLRMWKFDANLNPVAVAVTALPLSGLVADLFWLTDTHVVIVDSTNGSWFGVLNRSTDTFTWTRMETSANLVAGAKMDETGELFFFARAAAAPFLRLWRRTGDAVALATFTGTGPALAAQLAWSDPVNHNYLMARPAGGTAVYIAWSYDTAGNVIQYSNSFLALDPPANGATAYMPAAAWSPSGRHIVYSTDNAADYYLRMELRTAIIRPTKYVRADPTVLTVPLPAAAMDIKFAGDSLLLVSVNSATLGTGRVRGFVTSDGNEALTEIDAISDLFDDWNAIIQEIGVGPEVIITTKSMVYNSAPAAIVGRTADLANLKIALLNNTASFDATATTLAAVAGAKEVYGSSWPQGGIDANDGSYSVVGPGVYALDLVIPPFDLALTGTLNFRYAVIYDNTDAGKKPLVFIDFGSDQSATQLDRMQFASPSNHIVTFAVNNT